MNKKKIIFIFIFLVVLLPIFSIASSSYVVTQHCTSIKCMKNNDDVTCYCSQIDSSDNQYAGGGISSGPTGSAYVFSYQNSTQIPLGSRIDNVTVCVKWKVSTGGICGIFLNNGTNVLLSNDCHTNEALYCYDGTQHVPNASVANNLGVNVTEYYSGKLYVNWVYVNVTYEKFIKSDYWNLTLNNSVIPDGANLTRDDILNASTHWNLTSGLDVGLIEHNGTGYFANYTIPEPYTGNWTIYTIDLSNGNQFPRAGKVYVRSYANETYGWENSTNFHYFYLWGYSSISNILLSDYLIYNGTSVDINCRVIDSNTSIGIGSYKVFFYNQTSFLGYNLTNSSGWAVWHYKDNTNNPPASYNLTCNITNQQDLFYNASSNNKKTATLNVTDLIVKVNTNVKKIDLGESVKIMANVTTQGPEPKNVWANISFLNISEGELNREEEMINLNLDGAISSNVYSYSYYYTPSRSGQYNITVFVNDTRLRWNVTTFNVTFGEGVVDFMFPNFRIMNNQTFNLIINVTATNGDLFNANFTLNITDHNVLNITQGETWSKSSLYNLTNDTTITLRWSCRSIDEGLTRVILTITSQGGSSTTSEPFEVIKPIVLAEPDVVNISQTLNRAAKIVGNVTEISFVDFATTDISNAGCSVYSPSSVVDERECVGTGTAVGNIAPTANETCSPSGDCYHVNDEDNETSWIGTNAGNYINLTFGNQYIISKIEIVWKDLGSGSKVDISYVNETNTNSVYKNIDVPDTKNTITFDDFLPFKTNTIIINQTTDSTLVVYEVRLYTIEKRVGKCYIYKCLLSGDKLSKSGIFHMNVTVDTERDRTMNNFSFLVNYGWPDIEIGKLSMINGSTDIYRATVTAKNGDLYDLNISLGIENKTVLNLTNGSWNLTSPVIMNGNSQTFQWNISSLSVGTTNTSVFVNSSTGKGHYGISFSNVTVVLSAGAPPNITDIWVEEKNTKITKANLHANVIVYANAYDDVGLKNVVLNLTYPNGETKTGSFQYVSGNQWELIFGDNNDGIDLNETGNYTIRAYAEDIGGQKKYSGEDAGCPENYTLNVTDRYILVLWNYQSGPFMRGENLTVSAYDVNDFLVGNLNWYINLTRYGESGETFNSNRDNFTYQLTSSDPVGEYSLYAWSEKNGNTGESTWFFNVSNVLHPIFVEPPENSQYSPGSPITPIPQVQVLNVRNELSPFDDDVKLTCPNGEFYLDKVGDLYYNISQDCMASSSPQSTFYITAYVKDIYKNSGSSSLQLLTTSEPTSPGGGGGGGGGGTPQCIPTKENCTDGIDNDCDGFTDCFDPDCSKDPACIVKVEDFNFTIDTNAINVVQGGNGTIIGSVFNLGNTKLTLNVGIEGECCDIISQKEIILPVEGEKDFPIIIHAPLLTEPKEYLAKIKVSTTTLEKERTFKINVNENPTKKSLNNLEEELSKIKSEIKSYEKEGMDVSSLNSESIEVEKNIENAKSAIKEDNIFMLENSVSSAKKGIEFINSRITSMKIEKFFYKNKWYILSGILVVFLLSFLITEVLIPYYMRWKFQ